MKGFALVLLLVAAAQARSTGVEVGRPAASLGENPWLVHLRVAVSTSGFLRSCAGSLIDGRWVLTTASCLTDATFIWVRYGVVDVLTPSLVTEGGAGAGANFRRHPGYDAATGANDIALVRINRYVLNPPTENIATVPLAPVDAEVPSSGKVCTFGADEDGAPADTLSCVDASLTAQEDGSISADAETTNFDLGAPLVQDGVQYGILTKAGDSTGFLNPAAYVEWIESEAEIDLSPPEAGGGDGDDGDDVDAGRIVHFVN